MTGKEGGSERQAPKISQGFFWRGDDPEKRAAILEAAFDYRGDVTLTLGSGERITGYLSNRNDRAEEPHLDFFPAAGDSRLRLAYRDILAVEFSGKDTASGKSWEGWVRRWNAKKQAEALGKEVGEIGLYPEELD
jgi:hypothetical protein